MLKKTQEPVSIDLDDLGPMLFSSLRYAMGRMSYIVGDTIRWIRTYWPHLEGTKWQELILRDLTEELKRHDRDGTYMGMSFDHQAWATLREDLKRSLSR